jgi:hypothetical protein
VYCVALDSTVAEFRPAGVPSAMVVA